MNALTTHWLEPLHDWPRAALELLANHTVLIRIVVARVRGSAPREVGTSMLVADQHLLGTIGGGQLEHTAIEVARQMLAESPQPMVKLEHYTLATQLAQCCGGVVDIWFERYVQSDQGFLRAVERATRTAASSLEIVYANGAVDRRITPQRLSPAVVQADDSLRWQEPLRDARPEVWLFGAGHVGQAVVKVLSELPVRVKWLDPRPELMPGTFANVTTQQCDDPAQCVDEAPSGTHFIVMTHSHALDYAICRSVLLRRNAASLGLIGSVSKSARFRSRLLHEGLSADAIAQLTCPIGLDGIHSKEPAVIAIAIAAQLLKRIDTGTDVRPSKRTHGPQTCATADANGGCSVCASNRVAS